MAICHKVTLFDKHDILPSHVYHVEHSSKIAAGAIAASVAMKSGIDVTLLDIATEQFNLITAMESDNYAI